MDNSKQPLVSVGVPFYNSDKYLSDAIKSVLNQTYSNLEVLLMDDGSSDKSLKIAKDFEKSDNRVTVISDGKNQGLPTRLNQLSQLAKGKYYARMDADDIMFPDRIQVQVQFLLENPDVDLLGTGIIAINNSNDIIGKRKGGALKQVNFKQAIQGSWAAHPSITGTSKWFKKNKYDESLRRSQDFELWLRTVENSNFQRLETPLLFYREASTSSIKKYIQSTKYSFKTFWKNKHKTGVLFAMFNIAKKLNKLLVYTLLHLVGSTDTLIQRRSHKLSDFNIDNYINILQRALI